MATALPVAIACLTAACEDRSDYGEVEERVDAVADVIEREVDAFRKDARQRLEYVERDLERLRAESADESAAIREGMKREIEAFEKRKEELEDRLRALRGESREAWDSIRTELAREMAELERSIRHLKTDLAGSKPEKTPWPSILHRVAFEAGSHSWSSLRSPWDESRAI